MSMETLKWDATPEEFNLIEKIATRAVAKAKAAGIKYSKQDALMDINAVHSNGTPLRLAELLEADDTNFGHDVFGIRRFIDRNTGQLGGCFVPRFARRIAT